MFGSLAVSTLLLAVLPTAAGAIGEATRFEIRGVQIGEGAEPRPAARRRLAWEVRKRTSVQTRLAPRRVRLDDPTIFETPFLFWSGSEPFAPLSVAEISGLRRFVDFGGMVVIDDAAPESTGFDASIRRALGRAFPSAPLTRVPSDHTVFRAYYLVDRPVGRVHGPAFLEGIERGDRLAVIYTRHDLAGALERDDLGTHRFQVSPGGEMQREAAHRLAVNLVLYALCLDYKDDQVHAPFIMRRRALNP